MSDCGNPDCNGTFDEDLENIAADLNLCMDSCRTHLDDEVLEELRAGFKRLLGVVGAMAGLASDGDAFWVENQPGKGAVG